MAPGRTIPTVFCRHCGYNLRGLPGNSCAECGRAFDPGDRKTYSRRPGCPSRRRRTRCIVALFLGTVILTTAAGFGLWLPWHRDAAAIRMVHDCGGTIQTTTVGPQWLRGVLGRRGGVLLERAGPRCDLSHSLVTDMDLALLDGLPELRELHLVRTAVTDAGLARLRDLNGLRALFLGETAVTDGGMKYLANLDGLRELDLRETNVTDAGVADLAELKGLRRLCLGYTRVTDAGLGKLRPLGKLEVLGLFHTSVSDAGVGQLGELPQLAKLSLADTRATDLGLEHLTDAKKLDYLDLSGTGVTEAGAVALRRALPGCEVFKPDP